MAKTIDQQPLKPTVMSGPGSLTLQRKDSEHHLSDDEIVKSLGSGIYSLLPGDMVGGDAVARIATGLRAARGFRLLLVPDIKAVEGLADKICDVLAFHGAKVFHARELSAVATLIEKQLPANARVATGAKEDTSVTDLDRLKKLVRHPAWLSALGIVVATAQVDQIIPIAKLFQRVDLCAVLPSGKNFTDLMLNRTDEEGAALVVELEQYADIFSKMGIPVIKTNGDPKQLLKATSFTSGLDSVFAAHQRRSKGDTV